MNIYLMRHGETDWNVLHRMQGRSDIPLNEHGLTQAKAAALAMRSIPFDRIFSSPLQRAIQTAHAVADGRGLSIQIEPRITEMGFGTMEGLSLSEHPALRQSFFGDPEHYIPSEGAETYAQLDARCRSVLDQLLPSLEQTHSNVLLVSHGALIRGIVQRVLDRPLSEFWRNSPMKNCSCTILTCENGVYHLVEEGRIYE